MLAPRGAMSVLDKTDREIWELIDSGALTWCFDVSLEPERARKRELRILPECIADFAEGRKSEMTWVQVFGLLIPHGEPVLAAGEIEHCLNVSDLHVVNLAERKLLNRCERGGRGIGGAKFTKASFTSFLTARRVI